MTAARLLWTPPDAAGRFLPEGPRAIRWKGRDWLAWVNIQTSPDAKTGTVNLRAWDTGEVITLPQPGRPGFIVPTSTEGQLFVGQTHSVGTLDLGTNTFTPLAKIPDTGSGGRVIINDGECVPGGTAVVFGTKDTEFKEPVAALYLFTLDDQKITVLTEGQICSNGKVFAREDGTLVLYDIDTPTRKISRYALDLDARSATHLGTAVDLKDANASPDGMRDAGDGTVVVAFYNAAALDTGRAVQYRLSDGEIVREWSVPGASRVTCPCFVRRNGRVSLVLTTADEGMPDLNRTVAPQSGSLFEADADGVEPPAGEVLRV